MEDKLDLNKLIKDIESKITSCHENMVSLNNHIDNNGLRTSGQILSQKENSEKIKSDDDSNEKHKKLALKKNEIETNFIKNFIIRTFDDISNNQNKYNLFKINIDYNYGSITIGLGGRYTTTKIELISDTYEVKYKNDRVDLKANDKDLYESSINKAIELKSIIDSIKNKKILDTNKNLLYWFKGSNIERIMKITILNKHNK